MTTEKSSIALSFASFAKAAIPPEATPEQLHDMEIAFFGGALTVFTIMLEGMGGEDDDDEEQGMAVISALNDELEAFSDKLTNIDQ